MLTRFSTATKDTQATTATTRQPSVGSEVQPHSLPLLSARMRGARVSAMRIEPAKSIDRGRLGSRDSVTVAAVSTYTHHAYGRIHPEETLPAGQVDQNTTEKWSGGRAHSGGGTPQ